MSKASEVVAGLLRDAKSRQATIADSVRAAERTSGKRRAQLAAVDAEVRELEADLAALQRRQLTIISGGAA